MSAEDNKAIVRRFLTEYLNDHNVAVVDELFTSDYVNHLMPPGTPVGQGSEKQLFYMFYSGFPDFRITINDIIGDGDKVAARWTFHGTEHGRVPGYAGHGKTKPPLRPPMSSASRTAK